MTQIRPRLDDDLAAEVQAYADRLSREVGTRISFNAAVTVLLRRALRDAGQEHDARQGQWAQDTGTAAPVVLRAGTPVIRPQTLD